MNKENLKFAKNLEFLMEEKGVPRQKLAVDLAINECSVHEYLNGTIPRNAKFLEIANYFEVDDLAALLEGTPDDLVKSRTAPAKFGLIRE